MPDEVIEGYKLSPQQKRLWSLQQNSRAYQSRLAILIQGTLNVELLKESLQKLIKRHEILRTTFYKLPEIQHPIQVISCTNNISWQEVDLTSWVNEKQEGRIEEIFEEEEQHCFDIEKGLLLRCNLLTLSTQKHILLITLPSLCADAQTLENFVKEISCLYGTYPTDLEEPIQYIQFSELQNELIESANTQIERGYWRNKNIYELLNVKLPLVNQTCKEGRRQKAEGRREEFERGFNPAQFLATKSEIMVGDSDPCSLWSRAEGENSIPSASCLLPSAFLVEKAEFLPKCITLTVDPDLLKNIEIIIQKYNTSISVFFLACWQVLLWRLTGQSDLIVGFYFHGRIYEELEEVIGLLAKYLPVHSHLEDNYKFSKLLWQVTESISEVEEWQEYFSWDQAVVETKKLEEPSFLPFGFDFQKQPSKYSADEVSFEIYQQYNCIERFQVKLSCIVQKNSIITKFYYDSNLFAQQHINYLVRQFHTLLESIVSNPETSIGKLEILSDIERQQLLFKFNDTGTDYPLNKCIHQLIEEQAERTPDNLAVVFEKQQLTYQELNARANQLAHHLQTLGVKPEVLVGICMERSLDMLVGILGILKAGGAYVPIDPTSPLDRLAYMLEDSQVPVLLTQERLLKNLPAHGVQVICIDASWDTIAKESDDNLVSGVITDNLAYVIYTSGSTGKPKGVQITHQNLVHSINARIFYYHKPVTSFLLTSPFAFDSSVAGIFWTFCQGGVLSLPAENFQLDFSQIIEAIAKHQISHLLCLPSLYKLILEQAKPQQLVSLQTVIVAGESCPQKLVEQHRELLPSTSLFNEYGPTEGTVWSSVYDCQKHDLKTVVPIGSPIPNTQIYLLDAHLQPVSIGVAGELHIGGFGLARGYLNRPELTAEKFISNPFSDEGETHLYKTGDLARYLWDGNIEFLGRIDHQVKIRGFRIELGEIEALLTQHPNLREAIVLAQEDNIGNKRLIAYIVPNQEPAPKVSELRSFLKNYLPDYMIPSDFVVLKTLPLNPNGKVDRQALPAFKQEKSELEVAFVVPRTSVEKTLAQIWCQVLSLERVGIHDNFFELGGDSILLTQLIFRVQGTFQVELPLRSLFKMPTVASLAESIEMVQDTSSDTIDGKTVVDLQAEAVLDRTIRLEAIQREYTTEPANIFLTGATGFLGAFLLDELLQKTQADIYCLVRSANAEEGKNQIRIKLEMYSLWNEHLSSRIIPVVGDLSQPFFGLSKAEFLLLANKIDIIYHNGALVNFIYPYEQLKAVNVLGTQEVLRLASLIKVKPVHYISTLSVFPARSATEVQVFCEQDCLEHDGILQSGYAQSKWVAEKLVTIAHSRGLPVSIYRLGRITGNSKTGVWNTNDFMRRMIKCCIQLGSVPEIDNLVDMTPVDYVSQAVIYLSKQKESIGEVFHLLNPQPIKLEELIEWVCSYGYPLQLTTYEEWRKKLIDTANHSSDQTLRSLLPLFPKGRYEDVISIPEGLQPKMTQFDCENTLNKLADTSIVCPSINAELLENYFCYFARSGFLNYPHS